MAVLVGLVILGGIKSIAQVASFIVPIMWVSTYWHASIFWYPFLRNPRGFSPDYQPGLFSRAAFGGFLGVLIIEVKRAVFSNEAGIGSAAIAHSAAKVKNRLRKVSCLYSNHSSIQSWFAP